MPPVGRAARCLPLLVVLLASTAFGAPLSPDGGVPEPAPAKTPDDTLLKHRVPLEALTEHAIGLTSRPVRFDWRSTSVGFGAFLSQELEFNTFWSHAFGGVVRRPLGGLLGELGVAWVGTFSTDSSLKLAKTPYRQFGRPARFELQLAVGLPLAEGIVTLWPSFFPAAELVVSATGGVRYLLYRESFTGVRWEDAPSFFAGSLTKRERENLLLTRPEGMEVDGARYGLLVGLTTDLYFHSGFSVSLRCLVALPMPVADAHLGWWWEPTVSLGWAY